MYDKIITWLVAALVRAVKTAAQTALAAIGSSALLTEVDWSVVGLTVALAVVASLLTSIAGIPEVEGGTSLPALASGASGDEDDEDDFDDDEDVDDVIDYE